MIVLGVDTATPKASVAVLKDGNLLGETSTGGEKSHSETLLLAINSVLDDAGVSLKDVSLFAVGLGPGAFTALRVGVTTMKAISYALSVPLVGISTLNVLAAQAQYDGVILLVIDARKGEVFTAPFEIDKSGNVKRLGDYNSLKPDELFNLNDLHGGQCLLLGSGVPIVKDRMGNNVKIADEALWNVDAAFLCHLALKKFKQVGTPVPKEIKPLYVRKSDAEINLAKKSVLKTILKNSTDK
jgi:tRNA threonylcarbamoyladenosine biosynthesis protein TsaB